MDDIALLARVGEDVPDREPADVIRGRAALVRAIAEPAAAPARSLRSWVWAGSAVAATCALTGVIVFSGAFGAPGGADPAAAAVLASAATAARGESDAVVGPAQYLEVRTDAVYGASGYVEADVEKARGEGDGDVSNVPMTSVLESEVSALWIPADRSDDWVWVACSRFPVQTFGPRSEAMAADLAASSEVPDVRRTLPAGRIDGAGPFSGYQTGSGMSDDLSALPQDPAQLLQTIYAFNGAAGPSRDGEALVWIADTLRKGTVPARLRSVLYDTAALIPGVTITEEQATLNGRTGTAIGRDEADSGFRQDIILDPATGAFIGERQVLLHDGIDMPAGTATASTSVTTTVVDAVPTGTTLCAR